MAKLANSDLFLVGSVPVASDKPEDAMRLCGRVLGDHLFALPDGEVGERRMWIGGLGATTFSKHPDLEKAPEAGPFGAYRFKPGVTSNPILICEVRANGAGAKLQSDLLGNPQPPSAT
jgi:hypothetical protein